MPFPGASPSVDNPVKDATVNTGGGGGGAGYHPQAGPYPATMTAGNGASGFVCIRYQV